ncbi:MAG: hypothetical protein V1857_05050 [archaeon]
MKILPRIGFLAEKSGLCGVAVGISLICPQTSLAVRGSALNSKLLTHIAAAATTTTQTTD